MSLKKKDKERNHGSAWDVGKKSSISYPGHAKIQQII